MLRRAKSHLQVESSFSGETVIKIPYFPISELSRKECNSSNRKSTKKTMGFDQLVTKSTIVQLACMKVR